MKRDLRWDRVLRFLVTAFCGLITAGCGTADVSGPDDPLVSEVGVVLNSLDVSLTVFDPTDVQEPRTLGLAADGSPVGFALRGDLVVVPLGFVPAATVVDIGLGAARHTVALPEGSGATGVAFLNDSVALVANPNLDSVTPVNVLSGSAGEEVPVGRYPQAVTVTAGRVFVLNAELGPNFLPAGPGTLTVLDAEDLSPLGTVGLSGTNPASAAVGPDGRLYVVNAGSFGGGDGSLSIVDPSSLEELELVSGFGEFPFASTFGPDGNLYVSSFAFGISIWNPTTRAFVRSTAEAIAPEGSSSSPGAAFDSADRLHALRPDCRQPSAVLRLDDNFQVETTVPVGICPIDLAFTLVGGG